jgi:TonB family protein
VITQPDWLRKPSGRDLAEHYPDLASRLGIPGYALLVCSVGATGLLVDCRAESERPSDLGFGRAALAISGAFRMRPMTVNGKPIDGGTVRIPLEFRLPPENARQPPAPVSAEAERQAYRLADAQHTVDLASKSWEKYARDTENLADSAGSQATRLAAAEALRQAARAHAGDVRTAYARAYAAVFSEDEMSGVADFYGGVGAFFLDSDVLLNSQKMLSKEYGRKATEIANATFCAKHACSAADQRKVWRPNPQAGRIDDPVWAEEPTPAAISAATPRVAALLGFSGLVRVTCRVASTGRPYTCKLDDEAPKGFGYGSAGLAVAFAGGYRLHASQLANGGAGQKITMRIAFPAPSYPPAFVPPSGSAGARDLARRLTTSDGGELARRNAELEIANYASRLPLGAERRVYDAALDAYRTGVEAASRQYVEQRIDVWSTSFTEAQMTALLAFRGTPAGKAWGDRSNELEIAGRGALAYVSDLIVADARSRFCKTRDCDSKPPPRQPITDSSEPSARKP